MNYAGVLDRIGKTMGRAPRSLLFRGKWRMSPPDWLADDPYTQELFRHQDTLLKRGRLAWGAVVQANLILFSNTGPHAHLGSGSDLIWSDDPACINDPTPMLGVAPQLFEFKQGRTYDAETDQLGALLADEMLRKRRIPIPYAWSPAFPAVMSSIYLDRAHLPDRRLGGKLLPLLVLPEVTDTIMMVPGFLWPSDFIARTWS